MKFRSGESSRPDLQEGLVHQESVRRVLKLGLVPSRGAIHHAPMRYLDEIALTLFGSLYTDSP